MFKRARHWSRFAAALVAGILGFGVYPSDALAQRFSWDQINWSLGAGAVVVPDFEGSEDTEVKPLIHFKAERKSEYIELLFRTLKINVVPGGKWEFGPILNFRRKRGGVEDPRISAMRNIDEAVELGPFVGVNFGPLKAKLDGLFDVSDTHNGFLLSLSGGYEGPVAPRLRVSAEMALTYGDSKYTETYFGVNAADSSASGLRPFSPGDGFRDFAITLGADYRVYKGWSLRPIFRYEWLLGEAQDSPIVEVGADTQVYAGGMVVYSF